MEMDVETLCKAAYGERSEERANSRVDANRYARPKLECRFQLRTATRFVSIVGDPDAVNGVMRIAVGDSAVAVQRTCALVADTGNCNSIDREMSCRDARNFAAVASGVIQTDNVRHNCSSHLLDGGRSRWAVSSVIGPQDLAHAGWRFLRGVRVRKRRHRCKGCKRR